MILPDSMKNRLSENEELEHRVFASLVPFENWLKRSKPIFFPEYTDHGWKHVEQVICGSWALMTDAARELTTPEDVALLLIAIVLHDSAMHLTEDGFRSLIETHPAEFCLDGFNDQNWSVLWIDFVSESSRWSERQLTNIFGAPTSVSISSLDPTTLTLPQRLLIGEFLRRHHPRLAHEVALFGMPGPNSKDRLQLHDLEEDFRKLAGVIARSHGIDLRSTFDYLERNFGGSIGIREARRSHPVFLMAVLRISDYLQIQSDRAPRDFLKVTRLRSPISRREWDFHDAIKELRTTHEDPESIFVEANPRTVKIYLKFKSLIGDMQHELDGVWAVLGEIYGRFPPLDKLGITLRRVRSNFDLEGGLSPKLPFVPERFSFEAANADLLKLLIHPLYGDRPEVGLRELLQNSVDAVRELCLIYEKHGEEDGVRRIKEKPTVRLTIKSQGGSDCVFCIEDDGIGMALDVIKRYFLRAGATFRKSDAWRREFEHGGQSQVLRSGRFGVGVLAGFLIGDQISVSTRHFSEEVGYAFDATIDMDEIEIRREEREIGTTIKVKTNLAIAGRIDRNGWDWYCLSFPVVRRYALGSVKEQTHLFPESGSALPKGWYRVADSRYEDVQWTFEEKNLLICNGLKVIDRPIHFGMVEVDGVQTSAATSGMLYREADRIFHVPTISVFDPEGNLPLNLARNDVQVENLTFRDVLVSAVLKHFIHESIATAPKKPICEGNNITRYFVASGSDGSWVRMHDDFSFSQWFSVDNGVYLLTKGSVSASGINRLLFYPRAHIGDQNDFVFPRNLGALPECGHVGIASRENAHYRKHMLRFLLWGESSAISSAVLDREQLSALCRRVVCPKHLFETARTGNVLNSRILDNVTIEMDGKWAVIRTGPFLEPTCDMEAFVNSLPTRDNDWNPPVFAEWHLADSAHAPKVTRLHSVWKSFADSFLIPFDETDRKSLLSRLA